MASAVDQCKIRVIVTSKQFFGEGQARGDARHGFLVEDVLGGISKGARLWALVRGPPDAEELAIRGREILTSFATIIFSSGRHGARPRA